MLLLNSLNIQKTMDRYENGIFNLYSAYSDLTKDELDTTPIPNTWTPRFLLSHIVDFEPIISARLKLILSTKNPLLLGYDETSLAEQLNYSNRPVQLGLDLYKLVRIEMLTILKSIDEQSWNRVGVHNEIGRVTLWEYFQIACAHSEHHLYHLDIKRKAWGKTLLGVTKPVDYPPTWLFQK